MSSNPYGQGPGQSGSYEDFSPGYEPAPPAPYGQQPQAPYGQASTPSYGQPSPPVYGQPSTPQYGQPAPPSYGQASLPTYPQTNYEQPTYSQSDPYGQPYSRFAQPGYGQGLAPFSPAYDASSRPSVTMAQAVRLWLKNWRNFSGRASRSEYWWVVLASAILSVVVSMLFVAAVIAAAAVGNASDPTMSVLVLLLTGIMGIVGLATIVPSLSLGIRRLHDVNQSGWLYLLSFVPYIGGIILIVLMAQPSNPAGARFDDASQPLYGPENL